MSVHRFLLTDSAAGLWLDRFDLRPGPSLTLAGSGGWSVRKETLRGGLSDRIDMVTLDNGVFSIVVLPTRGMGVWKGTYRGLPVGWNSPAATPVHPAFVPLSDPLGWLRGFNELVCRCGLTSNGAPGPDPDGNPVESPLPLHGRIANLPAGRVEMAIDAAGPGTLSVSGIVDEASLFGSRLRLETTIATVAGSNEFSIRDVVTNRGAQPAESQLLYHVNVGPPFLGPGSRIVAPATEIAPRDATSAEGRRTWDVCRGPEAGFAEQVYLFKPVTNDRGESFVLLRNYGGDRAISVHYRTAALPCLSVWKNTAAEEDGYVVGLEPGTNYPNHRSFERSHGRVVTLGPGKSYETSVRIAVHDHLENVAALEAIAGMMTNDRPPTVHETPQPGWSPS